MAVRRTEPYAVGDVVKLRGVGTVKVDGPNGAELRIPAMRGEVELWLTAAGEWSYLWPNGDTGTLTVAEKTEPVGRIEGG